jgi:MtrB/PioB family decaheme-associated outer membrane protein
MNMHNNQFKLSAVALAVIGALMAMNALADEQEAAALKKPVNTVEIGVLNVPTDSAKFGEYSGLNKSGDYAIGNVNIRGGSAYEQNEQGATNRWSLRGSDLGFTSRALDAAISDQGSWNVGLQYDELKHNLSDSYMTPYSGAMGGANFTLPGFGLVANTNNGMTSAQMAAFQNMDISTTRKNTALSGSTVINSRLSLSFDYNHLDQTGAKLMGFGIAGVAGATGESVSILPMPTNYKTDTYTAALSWREGPSYASVTATSSIFTDRNSSVLFQSWAGASGMQNMPTAPDNLFNQLNLSAGSKLSNRTKWVGNLSYGVGSQNVPFVTTNSLLLSSTTPSSLNGSVVNTHADLKLIDQASRDWVLSGVLKFDDRDNRTSSNMYNFNAISGANTANYPNTPLSTRKTLFEVAGDYRLRDDQNVRIALAHESIERNCNSFASGSGTAYLSTSNCVVAKSSADNKLDATYRIKTSEETTVRVGYGLSDRKATADPYALAAFISKNGAIPGPVPAVNPAPAGQNAGDYFGFYPFFSASRLEQAIKASVNWQLSDQMDLGLSGRYTDDRYPDSTYGVQNGKTWSLNADVTYNYQENAAVNAYVTQQYRQRDMTNLQRYTTTVSAASATAISIPATASWTNNLIDQDITMGLGVKHGGLLAGKLQLGADMSYSLGNAAYNTMLNYNGATTGGLTCSNPAILSCGQLPDIRTLITRLKLGGIYQVDRSSSVALTYLLQRMDSNDYYFNGYQMGYVPNTLLPTNQNAGSYSIQVISASFIHNF